jgi:hypothetical protein
VPIQARASATICAWLGILIHSHGFTMRGIGGGGSTA